MDPEIEELIKKQVEKLPIEIRKLFTDPGLNDKILNIGKKNGLNVEQLGILQVETNLVMLGLVHPDEYQNELKNQLKINDEKVNGIIKDVNEQMLSGIREKLKKVYEEIDENSHEIGEEKENTQILKLAGIKIINTKETLPVLEKLELETIEKPEFIEKPKEEIRPVRSPEGSQGTPASNGTHPILAQKLTSSFQIPMVKTEYSLKNISKTNTAEKTTETKTPVPQAPKVYPKTGDPYRLNPNE